MKNDLNAVEQFLSAVFGPESSNAYITAFTEDPTGDYPLNVRGRMWGGGTYATMSERLTKDANQYVCVSTFNPSRDPKDNGRPRRQRALFNRCFAVMVDDIGTKVEWDAIKLRTFTALVETSEGNFQGWYALKRDDPDAADPRLVDYVVDAMIRQGLAKVDPGMKGVTRYGRLPGGVNNKRKLKAAWNVRMTEITDRTYTLAEIAEAYGIDLNAERERSLMKAKAGSHVHVPEDERERYAAALIEACERAGLEPHEHPNKPGGYDVLCPWRESHTDGDTTGSMLFIPGYVDPSSGVEYIIGGYKCHHGHCEGKSLRHLVAKLNEDHDARLPAPQWLTMPPLPVDRQKQIPGTARLQYSEKTGMPVKCEHNLDVILQYDGQYHSNAFRLAWDRFANETYVTWETETDPARRINARYPGRGVPPELIHLAGLDIYRVHAVQFTRPQLEQAFDTWLRMNTFDTALEWAETMALRWDGVKRLDTWLVEFAHAPDNAYVRRVSELVMLAAAKRALSPDGFKFDNLLILEGPQGIRKSSLLMTLCPKTEWFAALSFDAQNKDAVACSLGKIIIELEELQSVKRSEHGAMKAFLSKKSDRVRLPYEKMPADFARRCVYIGTTNDNHYLIDDTGNRRFWPVKLGGKTIDTEGLKAVRDLLWAEACARAKTMGEKEFILTEALAGVASVEAEERHVSRFDAWNDRLPGIASGLFEASGVVLMSAVLEQLGVPSAQQDAPKMKRVGAILRSLGYTTTRRRLQRGGPQVWVWLPCELE